MERMEKMDRPAHNPAPVQALALLLAEVGRNLGLGLCSEKASCFGWPICPDRGSMSSYKKADLTFLSLNCLISALTASLCTPTTSRDQH